MLNCISAGSPAAAVDITPPRDRVPQEDWTEEYVTVVPSGQVGQGAWRCQARFVFPAPHSDDRGLRGGSWRRAELAGELLHQELAQSEPMGWPSGAPPPAASAAGACSAVSTPSMATPASLAGVASPSMPGDWEVAPPMFATRDYIVVADLADQHLGLEFEGRPPDRVFVCTVDAATWASLNDIEVGDELASLNGRTPARTSMQEFGVLVRRIRPLKLRFLRQMPADTGDPNLSSADPPDTSCLSPVQVGPNESGDLVEGVSGKAIAGSAPQPPPSRHTGTSRPHPHVRGPSVQGKSGQVGDCAVALAPWHTAGWKSPRIGMRRPQRPASARSAPQRPASARSAVQVDENSQTASTPQSAPAPRTKSVKSPRGEGAAVPGASQRPRSAGPIPVHVRQQARANYESLLSRAPPSRAFIPTMLDSEVTSRLQQEILAARIQADLLRADLQALRMRRRGDPIAPLKADIFGCGLARRPVSAQYQDRQDPQLLGAQAHDQAQVPPAADPPEGSGESGASQLREILYLAEGPLCACTSPVDVQPLEADAPAQRHETSGCTGRSSRSGSPTSVRQEMDEILPAQRAQLHFACFPDPTTCPVLASVPLRAPQLGSPSTLRSENAEGAGEHSHAWRGLPVSSSAPVGSATPLFWAPLVSPLGSTLGTLSISLSISGGSVAPSPMVHEGRSERAMPRTEGVLRTSEGVCEDAFGMEVGAIEPVVEVSAITLQPAASVGR
mmetsp:Transcript_29259/g.97167  ORF Transcript_29259/g.97167 Transcript_29259/m.97167 type:complete len:730 (-) Transcript_29259:305-2494(-)